MQPDGTHARLERMLAALDDASDEAQAATAALTQYLAAHGENADTLDIDQIDAQADELEALARRTAVAAALLEHYQHHVSILLPPE